MILLRLAGLPRHRKVGHRRRAILQTAAEAVKPSPVSMGVEAGGQNLSKEPLLVLHGRMAGAHVQGSGPKASAPVGILQVLNIRLRPLPPRTKGTNHMINRTTRHLLAGGTAMALAVAGCSPSSDSAGANSTTSPPTSIPQLPVVATPVAASSPTGPEMLSTVGLYDRPPVTSVASRQGTFAIEKVDDVDTLTLNGKPVRYTPRGADAPAAVAADSGISLVGVFELSRESVAWVTIIGGTACAGTHVLVGARDGRALPGQAIPGCDDRGTMRRTGDKITFEAGGSEGTYEDGLISVTIKPGSDGQSPLATAM